MNSPLLVGDVGGTNTRFATAMYQAGKWEIAHFFKTPNDAFADFQTVMDTYLRSCAQKPSQACFAIAGPIYNNIVKLTNRDWTISGADLEGRFGFSQIKLVNDFAAMARAIPELPGACLKPIIAGTADNNAPILVAGPGTGFGVATLIKAATGAWNVLQGEGGHMAYAPQTPLEFEIANILMRAHGYVSNELVASGSGLPALHRAICEVYDIAYTNTPPIETFRRAAQGDDMFIALCKLRARATLRAAGDMALANGTLGGVVLAGGVTAHLYPYLIADDVTPSFAQRGPLSQYLSNCPVSMQTESTAPLIGAAALYAPSADRN